MSGLTEVAYISTCTFMTYTKTTLTSRLADIGLLRVDRGRERDTRVAELICTFFFINLLCRRAENFVASTRNLNVKDIQGKPRKRWADIVQRDALQIRGV